MATKRAAIYVRQSIDQAEGVDRQRRLCEKLVRDREWELVEVYEDNSISASKSRGKRTEWARMLADAQEGRFDVVVAVNLDRLIRSQRDLLSLLDLKVAVTTYDVGGLDLTSASGEMQATVLTAMARFEVRRKSERQLAANVDKANRGIPYVTKRPFGYLDDGRRLHDEEAKHVRWAYQQIIEGKSVWSIRKQWEAEGITPTVPKKVLELPESERPAPKSWGNSGVLNLLRRPRNAGIVTYRGKRIEGASSVLEAIVSVETFELVQSILESRARTAPISREPSRLLSGIAICGTCDNKMTSTVMNGKPVYRCETTMWPKRPPGKHPLITASLLDPKVVAALAQTILTKDGFGSAPPIDDDERQIQLDLAKIARRRAYLVGLEEDDERNGPFTLPQLRTLNDREEALKEELAGLRARKAESSALATIRSRFWSQVTDTGIDLFEAGRAREAIGEEFKTLSLTEQRTLIRATLSVKVWPTTEPLRVEIEKLDSPYEYPDEYEPELA